MDTWLKTLAEFEQNLKTCRTTQDCEQTLKKTLHSFAIQVYSFTYYNYYPGSPNKLKYDTAAPFLMAWHQHYIESGYDKIDSTLACSTQINIPIVWSVEEQIKAASSELEQQMRLDSKAYGVERGISFPVHGPEGDYAEMVVQQRFGENCLENSAELKFPLMLIATYYYQAIRTLLLKNLPEKLDNKYQLTHRERQCLILTAQSHSVTEIAKVLCITERTVNFHLQHANKKMGTKNKYHTVLKALFEHVISF